MRFTNFNVEVECTPSRSALMTGRLPVRSGTWRAASPRLPGGLAPWELTIAESLSAAGYATAIFGKWHLGDSPGRFPTDQGFDAWWGFPFSTNVATYVDRVGFDAQVAKVPLLLEGEKGAPVRELDPYTIENRPLIDARIAQDTLVLYLSDNGPDSADYPQASFSGPYRGYLGSAFEGSIRTPLLVRWPSRVEAGRTSNEIVALVDLFPTLASLASAEVPADRAIDGVDQSSFLLGETRASARESALFFSGRTLLSVKWRRFKIFLTGDDPEAATLEIPFQSQDEIEKSLSALRWTAMKRKPREALPSGQE